MMRRDDDRISRKSDVRVGGSYSVVVVRIGYEPNGQMIGRRLVDVGNASHIGKRFQHPITASSSLDRLVH